MALHETRLAFSRALRPRQKTWTRLSSTSSQTSSSHDLDELAPSSLHTSPLSQDQIDSFNPPENARKRKDQLPRSGYELLNSQLQSCQADTDEEIDTPSAHPDTIEDHFIHISLLHQQIYVLENSFLVHL